MEVALRLHTGKSAIASRETASRDCAVQRATELPRFPMVNKFPDNGNYYQLLQEIQ
jgi:hypothetical protein